MINEEISEIVFVSTMGCSSVNCDCSDPGTGSDSCECVYSYLKRKYYL